jgi:hypothetical protein
MAKYLSEEDMNTGEYISRDVALRQLNATCLATDCDNYNGVRCRACAYADAMDFIDAIPAADVQPVKHGKWIDAYTWTMFHEFKSSGRGEHFWCSECEQGQKQKSNYCPNCGARMDGGADDENS